jgi:hypothetical protein
MTKNFKKCWRILGATGAPNTADFRSWFKLKVLHWRILFFKVTTSSFLEGYPSFGPHPMRVSSACSLCSAGYMQRCDGEECQCGNLHEGVT